MISSDLIQFRNCRILRNHQIITEDLWIRDGRIINPEKIFFDEQKYAKVQIDCANAIIAPGFIDLQINGGYGVDFSYDTESVENGINIVAKNILAHGVTSFCPTIVTSPDLTYHKVLPKIIKRNGNENGATVLGVHLEGPFINQSKKGAHPENCIKDLINGMETLLATYGTLENVSIITLAPEKIKTTEVIQTLTAQGITVSLGHSMGDLKAGEIAAANGATLITHLFNAMLPFHHRDPGLVGLLASENIPLNQTMFYGIISDGVHTHPAALRIAHRTHPDGLIVVTDAISAMGLEDGVHHIGQFDMEVRSGRAYLANTDTLCGSIAAMDECVRILQKSTNCSLVYALESASLHPAKCLKIDQTKGTLNYDSDADLIFLDDNLKVRSTWIAGKCVYLLKDNNDPLVKQFTYFSKH